MHDNNLNKNSDIRKNTDLEGLMRTYGNMVLRVAYMYVKNKENAEDIFQEVFLSAYKAEANFRGESDYSTWLYRITVNKCKDFLKSAYNNRVVTADEEEDYYENDGAIFGSEESAEAVFMEKLEGEKLLDAVMRLPDKYKEVILAVYYKELELKEASKLLGIPEGTIKSRLFRARETLKSLLKGEFIIALCILTGLAAGIQL